MTTQKTTVGILFGGKSAEHEVSLQSAQNVLQAIDTEQFEPVLIGIDKSGFWHYIEDTNDPQIDATNANTIVTLQPGDQTGRLISGNGSIVKNIDVMFPILHGPMGEDGTIQGFLELANIPYVGPGVLGSAVGMDKDVMKRLLRDGGIPVSDFITATSSDIDTKAIVERFGLPLFVKPANMGSSVGVSKVTAEAELKSAVEEALLFDIKVLIEKAVDGDEIECAILGNDDPKASIIGRIIPKDGFYSYESKYVDESGAILEIPAKIPVEVAEKARQVALDTFKILGCEGMSRVDMFACQDDTIVVNEINTIPGFTKISMYPKLWEASGVSYTQLISQLLEFAVERAERRKELHTSYDKHL